MNLYHWTQPGLPTDFVRKIISDSWDNMTADEKQIYEKQVSKIENSTHILFIFYVVPVGTLYIVSFLNYLGKFKRIAQIGACVLYCNL